jgi:hypothetical protein
MLLIDKSQLKAEHLIKQIFLILAAVIHYDTNVPPDIADAAISNSTFASDATAYKKHLLKFHF